MATLAGNLWEHNFAKVVVVDVSDDYLLMQPPLPSYLYPVIKETWLPKHVLDSNLPNRDLVNGFLYDWHEAPSDDSGCWYVGMVAEGLANSLLADFGATAKSILA